jgi:alpha-tubulin suppressor-like RCC1 family protein
MRIQTRVLVCLAASLLLSSAVRVASAGPATAVAAGFDHTCAILTGGVVSCWGYNGSGQLGDGTNVNRATPAPVSGLPAAAVGIGSGYEHTCAIVSGGALWCWGSNSNGQLGDGTISSSRTPVRVSGLSGVTAVTGGRWHTCALTTGGAVLCWGHNASGQLGDGTGIGRLTPTPVTGLSSGVVAIDAGDSHTCVILTGGGVRCWGDNSWGQLGDGTITNRLTPTGVSGLSSGVTALSAGSIHNCAVTGGTLRCWGTDANGQLGDGNFVQSRTTPVTPIGVSGATAVSGGGGHTCAIAGGVSCWGENDNGELGDPSQTLHQSRNTATPVSGAGAASMITAGFAHNCVLVSGGDVRCWGRNGSGQLGDGSFLDRNAPVLVVFPVVPTIAIDRTSLAFSVQRAAAALTAQTPAQTVHLVQSSGPAVAWTATSNSGWLTVSPASGSGSAALTLSVRFDPSLQTGGTMQGSITIAATGAANTLPPLDVHLAIVATPATPFGSFDTPSSGGTPLSGSFAVTGWTLDDIAVNRVELWRDLQPGETTPPFNSTPSDPRNGKVFIANATFVEGSRPDVEGLYPSTPFSYRAGWGYLLLTWGLWNRGNGNYTLYAFAFDAESNVSTIGSKTIVVSNNAADKPFGSIDTPTMGGDPGTSMNFGWGLTPLVNGAATCTIPANGVQVSIDSGPLQPVVYGDARSDIAGAFPGFSNSAAAGGHFSFDWSTLTNGPHTIGWYITDDCNRADGVGSRFFNVSTGATLVAGQTATEFRLKAEATRANPVASAFRRNDFPESDAPITVARGYGELPLVIDAGLAGSRVIEMKPGERIEVRLPHGYDQAYQLGPDGQSRALPTGATWDADSAIFYWQPAPGFFGRYRMVFSDGRERISVRLVIVP